MADPINTQQNPNKTLRKYKKGIQNQLFKIQIIIVGVVPETVYFFAGTLIAVTAFLLVR